MNTRDLYYVVGFLTHHAQRIDITMTLEGDENHKVTIDTIDGWRNQIRKVAKGSISELSDNQPVVITFFQKIDVLG